MVLETNILTCLLCFEGLISMSIAVVKKSRSLAWFICETGTPEKGDGGEGMNELKQGGCLRASESLANFFV